MGMDVHYSSATSEWGTPQGLFDDLDREFGFSFDVAASHSNAKCESYYTKDDDGLAQEWSGVCWMNPPYGRSIGKWVRKAYESSLKGATVVCLLPARTDTSWFHDYCTRGEIRFLRGRLLFTREDGGAPERVGPAPFPSMVVVFRGTSQGELEAAA